MKARYRALRALLLSPPYPSPSLSLFLSPTIFASLSLPLLYLPVSSASVSDDRKNNVQSCECDERSASSSRRE